MSKAKAEELGLTLARRDRRPRHGRRPRLHAAAAAGPRHRHGACEKEGITPADLDLVEINEAFAAVGLASAKELGIDVDKVNVNGGAIALGHPIGMSGARIALHLALELKRRGGGVGAAALCGGGGQGDALDHPRAQDRLTSESLYVARRSVDVPALVESARAGSPRAVARLISLVEDGHESLREVMAALAPARRQRLGHRYHRLARRRQVDDDHRARAAPSASAGSGSACSRSTRARPSRVARCSATASACRTTRSTPRSTSARWPRAGTSAVCRSRRRRRIRVLDAAGCDVVLVETVGVGQSEVEIAGLADTSVVLLAPGMGDGIQAAKAGILEIGDVFVVNKADRDGADATVRDLRHMISLGDRTEPGLWRPPVVKTVAAQKIGIDEVMEALDKHRAHIEENGELVQRRERRVADEIETIALATLRARLGHLGGRAGVTALAREVIAGRTDPYAAADRLVEQIGT